MFMENHPHIQQVYRLFNLEVQPFRKVHRLIDLFETIIKTHTAVIMAEYFRHNRLSDTAKGMLAQGLRTPPLGTWQRFSRVLFEELVGEEYAWSFPDFPDEFAQLDKALNADKTNVIAFRNTYAHGATPTNEQCEGDILKFEPFLQRLLQCGWLRNTRLESRENKVWMLSDAKSLCLHPILVYRDEGKAQPYAFFNDLKNDKVGMLNYPLSKFYREKEFTREFFEYLPLHEWRKSGNQEFFQRIEELTETFKGRLPEREKLMKFVQERHKGYLSILGNPGIGKSALIAQFFKDLRAREEMGAIRVVEYFIGRGTAQAQPEILFNYLIRRTDELFAAGREIRAEGKTIWDLQQQLFAKWRLWGGQCAGSKLLFLIDGLDEGTENKLVSYMPRENFDGVLIIYGSRPGGHKTIDELWTQLPVEQHVRLELSGLGAEDIRALIYEVANKYELERESDWINAVQQRSQGNPLYLRLLCDALEHGSIAINDIHALPSKIDDYYKAILSRYAADTTDGDHLLAGLFTFAAARDSLTMAHLGLINKLGDATMHRIGSTLKEVLYENPLTEEVLVYQLFHESFRDYLLREKRKQVSEAAERIIDCCSGWKELEGSWEQRYALEHYAAHLASSRKAGRTGLLFGLIYDHDYQDTQKKVLRGFEACKTLFRTALSSASEQNRFDDMLESALCLVNLKYEEANDAPQIVDMVANGEIELALKRIERFGGGDKEGIKQKFILYMLCLMELTLLESRKQPFRKSAIQTLLGHLDEQIPADTSLINWNDFFPSYMIFKMASEWAELGLDYLIVYRRTQALDYDWIEETAQFDDSQFDILLSCSMGIPKDSNKCSILMVISTKLLKHGLIEESVSAIQESNKCLGRIIVDTEKDIALKVISIEMTKQGRIEESLEYARKISNDYGKSCALTEISTELAKQGKIEDSVFVLQESLKCAREISDNPKKVEALNAIAIQLTKIGKIAESLEIVRDMSDESDKSSTLIYISTELAKHSQFFESASVIEESLNCARHIGNESKKGSTFITISTELAKQGKFEESLACARGISEDLWKSMALATISTQLFLQNRIESSAIAMKEAFVCIRRIRSDFKKCYALSEISIELAKQGKIEESLESAGNISNDFLKKKAMAEISLEVAKQGKYEDSILCARQINDEFKKNITLNTISIEFLDKCKIEEFKSAIQETLAIDRGMNDASGKNTKLFTISTELVKQGKFEESLICARAINHEIRRRDLLKKISPELTKKGMVGELIASALEIREDYLKNSFLMEISIELVKQGRLEESLSCLQYINEESDKSRSLSLISTELAKQGQMRESEAVMQEALECVRDIHADFGKMKALSAISVELARQGKLEESLSCGQGIIDKFERRNLLAAISFEMAKRERVEESLAIIRDIHDEDFKNHTIYVISVELAEQGKPGGALEFVKHMNDESEKSRSLRVISNKLAEQGKFAESLSHARVISDNYGKSILLADISVILFKAGKVNQSENAIQESLLCARVVSDDFGKSLALTFIGTRLIILAKSEASINVLQEALVSARAINKHSDKSKALALISDAQAKKGNWLLAELVGMEIDAIQSRQECWKNLAKGVLKDSGWEKALQQAGQLNSNEARIFYLKGWAESVTMMSADTLCLKKALLPLMYDSASMELLLHNCALRELFFETASTSYNNRLNRTLKIQWAMDIKAQFPGNQQTARISTSLEAWIAEIADEDDRAEFELLAKKVRKGKMTEDEFEKRLSEYGGSTNQN
jgi:hypothetical protein